MMSDSSTGSGSAKLVVFTWNIDEKEEAFGFACEHLSQQGSFVAALQEVPDDDNSQSSILMMVEKHRLRLLSRTPDMDMHREEFKSTKSKVILLSSKDIEIDPIGKRHEGDSEYDDTRRLEGVTLRSQSWQDLQILGIHGLDLFNYPSEGKRAKWATRMRAIIDQFWADGPIIVMGDMNAHPWSPEIAGRDGLYAIRQKDWPDQESSKRQGARKPVKPLYNPMWRLLPDGDPDQRGTYFYAKAENDLRWHCLDQIIISEHLREHSSAPAVLTKLCGHDLVGSTGKPNISDHLPLQMVIEIGKVPSCQTSASS